MRHRWSFGLFDCLHNKPHCILTLLCPFVILHKISIKVKLKTFADFTLFLFMMTVTLAFWALVALKLLSNLQEGSSSYTALTVFLALVCCLLAAIAMAVVVTGVIVRYKVTHYQQLRRFDAMTEFMAACLCLPCSLCQMHNHLFPHHADVDDFETTELSEVVDGHPLKRR